MPAGFALDVDFFQPWLDEVRAGSAWQAFLDSGDDDTRAACDDVKAACASLTLTDARQAAVNEAMATLNAEHCFAVRSSSPEEDLAGTSFAGGYETTLGVTPDTLEEALRTSFTSVFDERIVAYKRQHGMATDDPRIAVIVQEQVPSEVSGVAFSLNPQNNCYDEAVINANFGLGETVVNGHVTPDTYVVEKVRGEILERGIASKSHAAWLVNGGGTEERDNVDPEAPSLTDEQTLAVAELAADAEEHYGAPMDIEWAIHDSTLYLLQSRPITAYVPLPAGMITEPGAQKRLYLDVVVLTQGFGDSLSVLGADLWGRMLVLMKAEIMVDAGAEGTIVNMDGRQYINLSAMLRALGMSMMGSLLKTYDTPTRKILDSVDFKAEYRPKKLPEALEGARWKMAKTGFRLLPTVVRGFVNLEKSLRDYDRLFEGDLERCRALIGQETPFDEMQEALLALFQNQLQSIGAIARVHGRPPPAREAVPGRRGSPGPARRAGDGPARQSDRRDGAPDVRAGIVRRTPGDRRRRRVRGEDSRPVVLGGLHDGLRSLHGPFRLPRHQGDRHRDAAVLREPAGVLRPATRHRPRNGRHRHGRAASHRSARTPVRDRAGAGQGEAGPKTRQHGP